MLNPHYVRTSDDIGDDDDSISDDDSSTDDSRNAEDSDESYDSDSNHSYLDNDEDQNHDSSGSNDLNVAAFTTAPDQPAPEGMSHRGKRSRSITPSSPPASKRRSFLAGSLSMSGLPSFLAPPTVRIQPTARMQRTEQWVLGHPQPSPPQEHIHRQHMPRLSYADHSLDASLERRRLVLRHANPEMISWGYLYEDLQLGTLPSLEQCKLGPPSQKLLTKIPILKCSRKNGVLEHFFITHAITEFQCQVVMESGDICGQVYKKSGRGVARTNHLISRHRALYDAVMEFRAYQCLVQEIKRPVRLVVDEDEMLAPPMTRFEAVREEVFLKSIKKPSSLDQDNFHINLLELVALEGASFDFLHSDDFRGMFELLNPLFLVPDTDFLQQKLDSEVQTRRLVMSTYFHQHVLYGAITADGWTSVDRTKFFGVTFHFVTPGYRMASMVIGMERVHSSQTAEDLLQILKRSVEEWRLQEKLIGGTTNQGANIKRSIELYRLQEQTGTSWIACSFHKTQLCIDKALDRSEESKAVVDKCRKISSLFRSSSVAMNILDKEQDRIYNRRYKILRVSSAPWNSTYNMACRILKIMDAITAAYNVMSSSESADVISKTKELGLVMFSEQETTALQEIVAVLRPAADFTDWAHKTRSSTMSQIYPRIFEMISVTDTWVTIEAKALHQSLISGLKDSWQLQSIPDVVLLAIFLNPASGSHSFLDETTSPDGSSLREQAGQLAMAAIKSHLEEQYLQQGHHNKPDAATIGDWTVRARDAVQIYNAELRSSSDKYANYKDCPEEFWLQHAQTPALKYLAIIARSYLSIQATSTELEPILSPLKADLSDHDFRNIVFFNSVCKVLSITQQ